MYVYKIHGIKMGRSIISKILILILVSGHSKHVANCDEDVPGDFCRDIRSLAELPNTDNEPFQHLLAICSVQDPPTFSSVRDSTLLNNFDYDTNKFDVHHHCQLFKFYLKVLEDNTRFIGARGLNGKPFTRGQMEVIKYNSRKGMSLCAKALTPSPENQAELYRIAIRIQSISAHASE